MRLIAYVDGSSLGNPGEAGYGIRIQDDKGNVLKSFGRYIGKATNNVAEYNALISCLEMAAGMKAESLKVFSDSELLVRQMNGLYRVKQDHLRVLYRRVLDIIDKTSMDFSIQHIEREKNRDADRLARRAVSARREILEP